LADLKETKNNPQKQFWDVLDDVHDVMLGSPDPEQHMQPMAPQIARDEGKIWFYTKTGSDLVKAVRDKGGAVHMCAISDNHDYHACVRGVLSENKSPKHIDRFWSSLVEAWFDGGKDDPELTMLCLNPDHARVWSSTGSNIKFGWEMAKANITDEEPEVGATADIDFRPSA
jgi:general stress protein 26